MIISPPFLPPKGSMTDDAWIELAMCGAPGNKGAYPIATNGTWHGGMHLQSPSDSGAALPVRSISDGIVAYVREATKPNQHESDPLNYDAGQSTSGWTSDGCVIIEHNTEIGNASESIRFFSIYMHLENIEKTVKQGRAIYRKDMIGMPGYIYGQPNLIHLEIICDDINLTKLVGRPSDTLSLTNDGRSDALYGDTYFYIPVGTALYATAPALPTHAAPHPSTPEQISTTEEEIFVQLRYDRHAFLTTFSANGSRIGDTVQENDAEYDLLKFARAFKPRSPSAMYEVLKFGRVVSENVPPSAASSHWRRIAYSSGIAWINLSSLTIKKFSDADFPHWCGWKLIDECSAPDSRVHSQDICELLDENHDGSITPDERIRSLTNLDIQKKLSRVICKLPTEWNAKTFDSRWGWIKKASLTNTIKLENSDFERLKRHVQKLSFWDEATPYMKNMPDNHWHFSPLEFIRHFRKCGWMSTKELAQCLPRRGLAGSLPWDIAHARAVEHKHSINFMLRKYFGEKRTRHIHVLAQIYHETGLLSLMNEDGEGCGKPYGAFFGRGYMQLTWPTNYAAYGEFMEISSISRGPYIDSRITPTSTHVWSTGGDAQRWHPKFDPAIVSNAVHRAESGGFFWISKHFRGTQNINRACDLDANPKIVAFISWLINGGQNGHDKRQQYAAFLHNLLMDQDPKKGSSSLRYPSLAPPTLCSHFPPLDVPYNQTIEVFYDRQIP